MINLKLGQNIKTLFLKYENLSATYDFFFLSKQYINDDS
jgi:hypothetical protein